MIQTSAWKFLHEREHFREEEKKKDLEKTQELYCVAQNQIQQDIYQLPSLAHILPSNEFQSIYKPTIFLISKFYFDKILVPSEFFFFFFLIFFFFLGVCFPVSVRLGQLITSFVQGILRKTPHAVKPRHIELNSLGLESWNEPFMLWPCLSGVQCPFWPLSKKHGHFYIMWPVV